MGKSLCPGLKKRSPYHLQYLKHMPFLKGISRVNQEGWRRTQVATDSAIKLPAIHNDGDMVWKEKK